MSDFDKVDYWIELSEYDFETAKAMLKTKRYLYAGFMCHQTIEKIFKALCVKTNGGFPSYTHNLIKLAKECNIFNELNDTQIDILVTLQPLNIETRYPEEKQRIYGLLNKEESKRIIKITEEMMLWIKNKL